MTEAVASPLVRRPHIGIGDIAFWGIALAGGFVFAGQFTFATAIVLAMMFAMSLNLILGYAGIITLGQGLFFGIGAYGVAFLSNAGLREPLGAVTLAGFSSALVAVPLAWLIVRLSGLPLIMVTLSLAALGYEIANEATWLTHGDDGMQGFTFTPILGLVHQGITGPQSYLFSLGWLFVLFVVVRTVVTSPFGVALQGIRENRARMVLIGSPVVRHLIVAYALSAFVAGVAGALTTETTQFVGLDSLSVDRSIDVLLMTVLGGIGTLYGPLLGAGVYELVHHFASEWNPYHWMFAIGILLIVVVRFARGGIVGLARTVGRRFA